MTRGGARVDTYWSMLFEIRVNATWLDDSMKTYSDDIAWDYDCNMAAVALSRSTSSRFDTNTSGHGDVPCADAHQSADRLRGVNASGVVFTTMIALRDGCDNEQ